MARAREMETKRDRAMAAYHNYEIASAAVQIAIVLASAQIITGVAALLWIAYALGAIGVAFSPDRLLLAERGAPILSFTERPQRDRSDRSRSRRRAETG